MAATGNPSGLVARKGALTVVSTQAQSAQSLQHWLQAEENRGLGQGESWCQSGGCSAECHCLVVCPGWQLELLMLQELGIRKLLIPLFRREVLQEYHSPPLRLKIVTSCGSSTDKRVADMKRVRK